MRNVDWLLPIIEATNQIPAWIGIVIAGFVILAMFKGADRADEKAGRYNPDQRSASSDATIFLILLVVIAVVGTKFYGG